MKKLKLITLIGILAVALGSVTAQADLITNGSFESGPDPGNGRITLFAGDTTTMPGWSVTAGDVDIIGNSVLLGSDGKFFMEMAGDGPGAMSTSLATTSGAQYKITFDLAGDFWAGAPGPFRLDVSAAGTTQTYLVSGPPAGWTLSNVGWTPKTFLFTANAATTTLEFKEVIVPGANYDYGNPNYYAGHGAFVDNVQGSMVPLPPSALLLGSGLLGLVGLRRFRKN